MQKFLKLISVLLITSLVTSPPAFSGGGFSGGSGGSSGGGFAKSVTVLSTDDLSDAIDAAESGSILMLGVGTWTECDINISGKDIAIVGAGVELSKVTCTNNTSTEIFNFSGYSQSNRVVLKDFSISGTTTSGLIKGVLVDQTAGTCLDKGVFVFDNIRSEVTASGGTNAFGIHLEDSMAIIRDVFAKGVSTSASSSDARGIAAYLESTCETGGVIKGEIHNSFFEAQTASNSSSYSARSLMMWNGNNAVDTAMLWDIYESYGRAKYSGSGGGETVGFYCVNDSTNASVNAVCNLYGGSYGADQYVSTSHTSRGLRCTGNSVGTISLNLYGTQFFGSGGVISGTDDFYQTDAECTITNYGKANFSSAIMTNGNTPRPNTVGAGRSAHEFKFVGGTGGDASQATGTQTGGEGADVNFAGGVGGAATATTGAGNGGSGGDFSFIGGAGAAQTNASGTTNTGGAGGDAVIGGGVGGAASGGSSTDTGGAGGSLYYYGGAGGVGTDANGRDGTVFVGNSAVTTSSGYVLTSGRYLTIAADDTTPDVRYSSDFITSANTGATAITDLDNPTIGQVVCITGGSSTNASTIADSGNFNLGVARTLNLDDRLCVKVQADNDYVEISWNDN